MCKALLLFKINEGVSKASSCPALDTAGHDAGHGQLHFTKLRYKRLQVTDSRQHITMMIKIMTLCRLV